MACPYYDECIPKVSDIVPWHVPTTWEHHSSINVTMKKRHAPMGQGRDALLISVRRYYLTKIFWPATM